MLSATQVDVNTTSGQIDAQLVTLSQKYLGNKEYVLSGTTTGYIGAEITPLAPWSNLANRYYPTVATLPQSGNNIKTKAELGGYFTPNNLGVSTYLAKNLTPLININEITPGNTYRYVDPNKFNKGRGLTENDQDNIITHLQNLSWLKASNTGTAFDGQVVGSDTYQKFIPYQSNFETTKLDSNGVTDVHNDYEFWTGDQKNIWLTTNKFTEEDWLRYFDIDTRVSKLLINSNKELYSWQTDVYGNQYALYKLPTGDRTIYNMQNAYGELWVKTVDGIVYTATDILSAIYNKHINEHAIYAQLSANNIKNFEVFFDTLVFELSGYTIFEKINFDYTTGQIITTNQDFLTLDYHQNVSTRILSSASLTGIKINDTAAVYYGGNWYDETNKKITSCLLLSAAVATTNSASALVVPVLYQYDINHPGKRVRIFPTNNTDYSYFFYNRGISSVNLDQELLTYIEPPLISYNQDTTSYIIDFVAYTNQNFKIISYNTKEATLGKVLVNEAVVPIVTDTGNNIVAV